MHFDLPEREKEILKFWKENKIFEKSLEKSKKRPTFVFYEGPPYANGKPGIHHVVARSFKDIVLRYKTMQGFYVKRKAGWDTHGLPAEIAAEKALGIKSKKEIEKIGVEKFIQICKENVFTYKKEWEEFTERIGYWLDMENPYVTCSNEYIESLFAIIKRFYERGLLYQENKVVPWCPRCQTTLAQHEIAQGYQKVKENSIYVKFKVKSNQKIGNKKIGDATYFLVWTTTPWTLPGNVAVAFNPKIKYVLAKQKKNKENYILAKERLENVFGKENYEILKELKKDDILNLKYEPLFTQELESQYKDRAWKVYPADFVSTEEGTGLVHIAPAFGEDDFNIGKENNLPALLTVDEEGKMKKGVIGEGKFVKDADKDIIEDLKKRNLLFGEEIYEHDYPFCWRCDTPVLYYLHPSWFVATKKVKKKLIENNKKVEWHPTYFKGGRFGNFLEEVRDWNFSRERYWGTPLPVWQCQKCSQIEVIGSREDILKQKFSSNRYFILRHGLAETNVKGILNSKPDKKYSITKIGKLQVKRSVKKLKNLLGNEKIDVILSSDIYRCKQTAEIVKKELNFKGKIIFKKELRDIKAGDWEGKSVSKYKKKFLNPPEAHFYSKPKGGESWNDCKRRMLNVIEKIEKEYKEKNILIIGHGDPLWLLYGAMKGLDNKEFVKTREGKEAYFKRGELKETEYKKFPYSKEGELDFHRPYIDKVVFDCRGCGGRMIRVKEVCDVWFDSGAMPFAQANWPFSQNQKLKIKNKKLVPPEFFPADFICEGIDQTRGWFYTLLTVSSLMGFSSPYKEVLSTGLVMDKTGKKMSKSRGNVVNPWEMSKKYGADTLRWYFYTINQPWAVKNFDEADLKKCFNRFILTLWHSFSFYKTYSENRRIKTDNPKSKNLLDRWIVSRLQNLTLNTTENLEKYKIVSVARKIESFVVDDLSNWYIRRSRARFQKPNNKKELHEVTQTLGFILFELSRILAPFIPFLSEEIYKDFKKGKNISVHFCDYPKADKKLIKNDLEDKMALVREIVALGLAERKKAGIKVRQPLRKLKIKNLKLKIEPELLGLIKEEINIKSIVFDSKIKKDVELDTKITKALKEEGLLREIIRAIQDARKKSSLKKENIIDIHYKGDSYLCRLLGGNKDLIKKETLSNNVEKKKKGDYLFDKKINLDKKEIWIGIKLVGSG